VLAYIQLQPHCWKNTGSTCMCVTDAHVSICVYMYSPGACIQNMDRKLDIPCLGCSQLVALEVCELFFVVHTCVLKLLANALLCWAYMLVFSCLWSANAQAYRNILITTIGHWFMSKFGAPSMTSAASHAMLPSTRCTRRSPAASPARPCTPPCTCGTAPLSPPAPLVGAQQLAKLP